MPQPLRIECPAITSLITTRTRASLLWFIRARAFEQKVLGYLAKYQQVYGVIIYAFVFQGNHYHLLARFPNGNRARFMQDLNSMIARLCSSYVEGFDGGTLWARRYAEQAVPNPDDIEERFFYCALQAVQSGLCERISHYKSFNSFYDAVQGEEREYKVFERAAYNERLRYDGKASKKEFIFKYKLIFSRLPGYEACSQEEYQSLFLTKLEARRTELVRRRLKQGLRFQDSRTLNKIRPGTKPRNSKTSTRESRRPLVLTRCFETKQRYLSWFFAVREAFLRASKLFRCGKADALFPPGTYKPRAHPLAFATL